MHFFRSILGICFLSVQILLFPEISRATPDITMDTAIADSTPVVFDKIIITGNNKTRSRIILREVGFREGDTLSAHQLQEVLHWSRNRIFNTGLFVTVDLQVIDRYENHKDLLIVVKERWYIYPIPIFELADRNFNEWWQQRGHDIRRINIGLFYTQRNVRGRNETLRTKIQFGFTKKFEVFYYIPYLNNNQRTGLNLEVSYILNKQIPFRTFHHKLAYFDYNQFVREKFRTGFTFSYRKKFYETHFFGLTYNYNHVSDTITSLNPKYLLDASTHQRFISLRYAFVRDRRDIAYYPLKGNYLNLEAEKLGIGMFDKMNLFSINAEYAIFKPLGKKFYAAAGIRQKLSFPYNQPYLQTRALGYDNDYVSGYELYVIDGQHFSLAKLHLKWQLFSVQKEVGAVPVRQFETIPFAVYLKAYSDAGYVVDNSFNPDNRRLSNKFLWGGGAGIDIVSYYDLVFRMEYSVNRLGESGFFLHFKAGI